MLVYGNYVGLSPLQGVQTHFFLFLISIHVRLKNVVFCHVQLNDEQTVIGHFIEEVLEECEGRELLVF